MTGASTGTDSGSKLLDQLPLLIAPTSENSRATLSSARHMIESFRISNAERMSHEGLMEQVIL
jgi:hypothetical protein